MNLIDDLQGLAAPAPPTLADGLLDRWVRVSGPPGEHTFDEVFVGFTAAGVRLVHPVLDDDADTALATFLAHYHDRFDRPLREAPRAPRGLEPALAGRSGDGPSLDLHGLSPFAVSVLEVTRRIPRGQTRPYAWVAREAGSPAAVRAAGSVLTRNPVPLVVPCHRVTRTDGALGHYQFGTERKAALLRGEGADLPRHRHRDAPHHHEETS